MRKIQEFDQNIVRALKRLKIPMKNYNQVDVFFYERKRKENTIEHIANKKHLLQVRDIEIIPLILADKNAVKDDKSQKYKVYYGKRQGSHKKKPYLKIITRIAKNKSEKIVTVYAVRRKE